MATVAADAGVLDLAPDKVSAWFAWNNLMPPGPASFHIVGDIEVPNPGVEPLLTMKLPQGINRRILLLTLSLIQKPGIWPQHVAVKQVRFDKCAATYERVSIFSDAGTLVADVTVQDIL